MRSMGMLLLGLLPLLAWSAETPRAGWYEVKTELSADGRTWRAQRAVAPGENEITAARALLETLTLEGALVTGDAIHCQAETAALIAAKGGDGTVRNSVFWRA